MKKYIEIMEHIYPTQEQKNNMLENAYKSADEPKKVRRKFGLRYCVPAVLLAALLSVNVFAEEIKNTFYGLLGNSEIVSEEVLNDVYSDTDGSVTMTVKEILSDKICTRVILEYTSLNEKGKEWLDSFMTVHKLNQPVLNPAVEGSGYAFGDYAYNFEELTELRTENTRVFRAMYNNGSDSYNTDSIELIYPLSKKWENQTVIDVSESVTLNDVRFDNSNAPDKYYKPMGVKISPLSIMIYGKDLGIVERGKTKCGGTYIKVIHDAKIDSLYLVMKDKTRYDLTDSDNVVTDYGGSGFVDNPEVDYDYTIYCAAFKDYMDIEQIDGVELDGVFYPVN